ncbi:MAG: hypothetical protein ACNA8L_09645 [Luteolibacter sp.]
MTLTPITLSAAVVSFATIGFFVGRITSPQDAPGSGGDSATMLDTRPARPGQSMAGNDDAPRRDVDTRRSTRDERVTPAQQATRLEAIVRGENALDRGRALLAFIDQLGPGEFEDAVAHFRSLGITQDRMGEYAMLLTAWAKADPITALEYAQANTQGDYARGTILGAWAAADPEAAIRWATANHTGDGPNPHLAGIIRGLAAQDPARATELLTSMPRSAERGQALDGILPHLIASGADAIRNWINSLSDDSLRNGALERAAVRLAAMDPAMAVDMLIANPGQATDRRLGDVFSTWAGQNQAGALVSMQSLPAGDLRSNALGGIVSNAARQNPQAALALLDAYPGDVNDSVIRSAAWSSFRQDPSVSANLISRYSDPRAQSRMYRRTLNVWLDRDPDAARAWIQSNPLPENVLQDLAERLQ